MQVKQAKWLKAFIVVMALALVVAMLSCADSVWAAPAVTIQDQTENTNPTESDYVPTYSATDQAGRKVEAGILIKEAHGLTGPSYVVIGSGGVMSSIKHNLSAATAPQVTDDTISGYATGSLWADLVANKAYLCFDATASAAVWVEITALAGSTISDFQAQDTDLDSAAGGSAAGNLKFWGTDADGTIGFYDQSNITPPQITDGTSVGQLTQWDGDSWEPIDELADMAIGGGTANRVAVWDSAGELDSGARAEGVIDSGASPTVDAAGEIAVDTTTDQLVYYGSAKRVLPYIQWLSFVIPAPAEADDINLFKAPYGMAISNIKCIVQGTTSATGQLQECTSAGATCVDLDSDIVCDADGAADDGSLTDSAIAKDAWVRWKTTSLSGTPTFLTVTVQYSVVSD